MGESIHKFNEVKANADIVAIIGRYTPLKKDQREFIGICPFHNEDTPSFKVNPTKNIFKCFGCGAGGDVFDFLMQYHRGLTHKEAVAIVKGEILPADHPQVKARKVAPSQAWKQDSDPDRDITNFQHIHKGVPVAVWPYRNAAGKAVSYDCRFEYTEKGKLKKDVLPITFMTDGKSKMWRWSAMDEKRLLSNLDKLVQHPDMPVVVVEGKKTAAAAELLFGKAIVTTWQGGGHAVHKADWSPLYGRDILIWQDNDYPGYETALQVHGELVANCPIIRFLHNPPGKEKGWDAADAVAEGWDVMSAADYVHKNTFAYPQVIEDPKKKTDDTKNEGGPASGRATNHAVRREAYGPGARGDGGAEQGNDRPGSGSDSIQAAIIGSNDNHTAGEAKGDVWPTSPELATYNDALGREVWVHPVEEKAAHPESKMFRPQGFDIIGTSEQAAPQGQENRGSQTVSQQIPDGQTSQWQRVAGPPIDAEDETEGAVEHNPYFRFLGFESNNGKLLHCFYNNVNKTIIKLSASGMSKPANLMELAPLNFWQRHYPNRREGVDHVKAVNKLLMISNTKGIFRTDNLRGRGAWIEKGRVVIHSGDHLIVDGQPIDMGDYDGKYVYEQGLPMGLTTDNPLTNKEAARLLELTKMLHWDRDVNAYLLAGFCVVAPMCGALQWRPHIWITGPSGCGKTWVFNQILKPLLGSTALCVQGSTSEPGLRQALRRDARPVAFDEAEGEDKNSQERMQQVLTLMRSASAEDSGDIIKGSSASGADAYQIRSCFAFASIGMQANQQSDRTRITTLSMKAYGNEQQRIDNFAAIIRLHTELMSGNFAMRLQARTIKMLPTILRNADTFSKAAASVLGQQRSGDQLGAQLAGAYSLVSDNTITYEQAIEWVRRHQWEEEEALKTTRDERVLFQHIMEQMISVEGAFTKYDRAIGECIRLILGFDEMKDSGGNPGDGHVTAYACEQRLLRTGIKIETDKKTYANIIISNSAAGIKHILRDTAWGRNHGSILARIPGATAKSNVRFGSGVQTRAVCIPASYFTDSE